MEPEIAIRCEMIQPERVYGTGDAEVDTSNAKAAIARAIEAGGAVVFEGTFAFNCSVVMRPRP